MRHVRLAAVSVAILLAGSACTNRADDGAATDSTAAPPTAAPGDTAPTTAAPADTAAATTTTAPAGAMFGTMASPCGPGDATIAEGQNGGDTLKLGTANDHGYEASPGLTIEMLDAAQAFAAWCNEQGGIQGLQLEVVDLDGKLFSPAPAMEQACAEVFAMVGGGWVFDDQIFPRFHECGMVNFAGYTVTPTAAMSNGKVQPIPNPSNDKPAAWLIWGRDTFPEAVQRTAIVYGNFLTTEIVKDSLRASMEAVGGWQVVDEIPTNPAGEASWAPFVQRMKDNNITALTFVGNDANFINLAKAMDEVGYRPELILLEANFYTDAMVADGTEQFTEGVYVRTAYAPFEEAEQFPGMRSYLDMMDRYRPDGKRAGLGLQATSAYLLFAEAANACIDANGGVLERECVLAKGTEVTSWTGGGLHTETSPGSNLPPPCGIIMQVQSGEWTRVFPELGSADDNGGGWHCEDDGVVRIEGDFGGTTAGIDPSRPS
jgi:ABC-type branched-subunit amino acid transport system substrate-binding protein